MPKRTVIVIVALLGLNGITAKLEAAVYYVSPSGSAKWPACTSITTPCSAVTAFQNAVAGDTVYFRGGTYSQTAAYGDGTNYPQTPYRPSHSGTASAWIMFAAYPGETPIINGYVPLTPDGSNFAVTESASVAYPLNQTHCLAVTGQSYIIFDGFRIYANGGTKLGVGKISIVNSTNVLLRNLSFNGGALLPAFASGSYDNTESLRIEASGSVVVSHCRFVGPRIAASGGNENHNVSSIKTYHNNAYWLANGGNNVYENCEFSNSTGAIFLKSSEGNATIRNNFIHDCYQGILLTPQGSTTQYASDGGTVTNNVIVNCTLAAFGSEDQTTPAHGNDWVLSNNTIYNTRSGFGYTLADAGHGWKFYNNISGNQSYAYDLSGSYVNLSTGVISRLAEEDHNQWGTGSIGFEYGRNYGYYRYTSLAAWQATKWLEGGGHPGGNDLASDPQFVNGSATLTELADFALKPTSPCKGAGRNGTDMGADVTKVGPLGTVTPPGRPAVKTP